MTIVAKRLKKLRGNAGLNQSQLAKSVGVTRAAASRWEQGDIDSILAKNAIRLADILGTSVEYIFTGKSKDTSAINVEALSQSINIVNDQLNGSSTPTHANTICLVYKMIIDGKSISKNTVRQLNEINGD
tara:strand:- start:1413 stop:1802 length:390 start_codon:yes stop_codon:yes gene_type:complete